MTLLYAIQQANEIGVPVLVVFGLTDRYPDANLRHFTFLIEGLHDVEQELDKLGIQLVVLEAPPDEATLLLAVVLYCFLPGRYLWSYLFLPLGIRILGVLVALFALLLLVWVHRTLGRNFSTGLSPKKDHSMVTEGPYALIRHPM